MIGRKKLSTIREELRQALAAAGDDPIHWLEERMGAPERQAGESEILQSLRRLLEAPEKERGREQRVET